MAAGRSRAGVVDLGAEHRPVLPTDGPVAGSERRTTLSVRMAAERETAVQRDPARTR